MALTNLDILHPLEAEGATGEWKSTYGTAPAPYADWAAYIDALIAAAPFDTDAKNKEWIYTDLYTTALNIDPATPFTFTSSKSTPDFSVTKKLLGPSYLQNRLRFWSNALSGKSYGSGLTTIESHF